MGGDGKNPSELAELVLAPEKKEVFVSKSDVADTVTPVIVYTPESGAGISAVLNDLRTGFRMGELWRAFALDEIQSRYRRSVLGLAWIAIGYLIFIGAVSVVFGSLSKMGMAQFTGYVAIGYLIFQFMMSCITEGCQVFRTSATWIKSTSLPHSIYVYKNLSRTLLPLAIQFATAIVLMLIIGWRPRLSIFLAAPAFAVILVNGLALQILFGYLATRWRDVSHLISAVTRLLFFVTPIIWVYGERGGIVRVISNLNPLTFYLDIFRAPILGEPGIDGAWSIVIICTLALVAAALFVASLMRRRLPLWL